MTNQIKDMSRGFAVALGFFAAQKVLDPMTPTQAALIGSVVAFTLFLLLFILTRRRR